MRLVSFVRDRKSRIGVLLWGRATIVDLSIAAPELPGEMAAFVAGGRRLIERALEVADRATEEGIVPLERVALRAPFPKPARNIMCIGKNYRDHAREFHASGFDATVREVAVPDTPIVFTKAPSSVIGPGDPIPSYLDSTST